MYLGGNLFWGKIDLVVPYLSVLSGIAVVRYNSSDFAC